MKVFRMMSIFALALALFSSITSAQGDMDTWIANAQAFYVEGVDENALLGNQFNDFSAIMPGMLGPDFTLLDINGIEFSLSQYLDNSFVVIETGSWY